MAREFFLDALWAIALLGLAAPAGAQVDLDWGARYPGTPWAQSWAVDVAADPVDNVLVLAAKQGLSSKYDFEIATLKYSSTGELLWSRVFDGSTHFIDSPRRLGVDAAGNVYVTGWTYGRISDWDFVVLAYDPSGALLWKRTFDRGLIDGALDMVVDGSGYVYLTGHSQAQATGMDLLTVAYDPSGNLLWERRVDGPGGGDDHGLALELDGSGRILVTGSVALTGSGSAYATICYDLAGTTLWTRLYDASSGDDTPSDLALDGQGNVFVTGSCEESAGAGRFRGVTVAYDANGTQRWVRRHGGVSPAVTAASRIAADASGNLVLAGGGRGLRTLKLDGAGRLLWERVYPDEGWAWALALDAYGRAFVVGSGDSTGTGPGIAMCYDTQGNRLWSEVLGGSTPWSTSRGFTIDLDSMGRLLLAGEAKPMVGSSAGQCATLVYRPTCDVFIDVYCSAKTSSQGCTPSIALLDAPTRPRARAARSPPGTWSPARSACSCTARPAPWPGPSMAASCAWMAPCSATSLAPPAALARPALAPCTRTSTPTSPRAPTRAWSPA